MGYDDIVALGADVLSISTDSVFSHKIWNETELSKMIGKDIPFPMASDQTGAIGRLYGVYDEEEGVNIRGRFLIDPEGVIQAAEVLSPRRTEPGRIDPPAQSLQASSRNR